MTSQRLRSFAQRRGVRACAVTALVLGPLGAIPVLVTTGASAGSAARCVDGAEPISVVSFHAHQGTATVALNPSGCDGDTVSLVSYEKAGLGTVASYPQEREDVVTAALTHAGGAVTLTVTVPSCSAQVELLAGSDAPAVQNGRPRSLLAVGDFGSTACATSAPPVSVTTVPSTSATPPPASSSAPPASTSSATSPPPSCTNADFTVERFNAHAGTAKVLLANPACDGSTVSLVSYEKAGLGTQASYPQTRQDIVSRTLTVAGGPVSLTVAVPACSAQVDLIRGDDAPATLTQAYFAPHGTLLTFGDFGNVPCTPTSPPPSTSTPPPSTSTSPPPSSSTTPPPSTSTPPPTTSTSPPPSSSTTPPPSTSTPPPVTTPPCISTSSAPPPTTSVTSSATTSTSTSVSATSTSATPTCTVAVLGFAATAAPPAAVDAVDGALPFTGPNAPVRGAVLLALGLLSGGGALLLLLGRPTPAGSYRRR